MIFVFPNSENPIKPGQRTNLKFSQKSTSRPSGWPRSNFLMPDSCSAGAKTPKTSFWGIFIILGKKSFFLNSLGGISKIFFRKYRAPLKNTMLAKVSGAWELLVRNGTKNQKGGNQKMKKWVRGSVGCWKKIVIFFLAHHEYYAKNRLEIGWG